MQIARTADLAEYRRVIIEISLRAMFWLVLTHLVFALASVGRSYCVAFVSVFQ